MNATVSLHRRALEALAVFVLALAGAVDLPAQEASYAVGDRVLVDANMASDPAYESWVAATITEIQTWQGRVSGIFVRTDDGRDLGTAERFLRRGAPPAPTAAATGTAANGHAPAAGAAVSAGASVGTRAASPAPPADPGTGNCRVGTRVTDREDRSGVVVRATGPSCWVKLDGSDEEGYYLQWMLRPEGQGARVARGGALETGAYTCWTANGVAGTLRLVVLSGSRYSDGKGNEGAYAYDAATGRIQWTSGPWGGFYGTKLGPGKIGISSRPGGFSNTTCDRK